MRFKKGDHFSYEQQDFSWLILKLAATFDGELMGCPVNIAETVLFKDGNAFMVVKTTKEDKCINQIKGGMDNTELHNYLKNLYADRNRDYQRKLQQLKYE